MKSKLLDISTCVLKTLSEFKRDIITPKKEETEKRMIAEMLCVNIGQFRVTEVIF